MSLPPIAQRPATQQAFALWHRIDSGAWLFNAINRLSPRMTYLLATLALAVIAASDFFTHVELMLAPFYALPCFLVDWRIGRMSALVYAVCASVVQWFIGTFGGHPYSHSFYLYWDIALNLIFYGVLLWMVAKLRLALEMEQALSRMDFLTRMANRKSFLKQLDAQLGTQRATPHTLVVLSVNLDRFIAFNQEQGYTVGDLALGAVADVVRRAARTTDLLGRTDNSEFSIVRLQVGAAGLVGVGGAADASLKSLQSQLELLMLARGWPLTFSLACASFAAAPDSAHAVMGKVRMLLEEAKHSGKNRSISRAWSAEGEVLGAPSSRSGPYLDFEQTTQMFVEPTDR